MLIDEDGGHNDDGHNSPHSSGGHGFLKDCLFLRYPSDGGREGEGAGSGWPKFSSQ